MKKLAIAAVALTALTSSLAFAMPNVEVASKSVTVKYSDLNVTQPEGAKALYSRLQNAAWRACRDLGVGSSTARFGLGTCIRDAVEAAVKDVNKPAVTALHEGGAIDGRTASR
jgi:UrcA family protein